MNQASHGAKPGAADVEQDRPAENIEGLWRLVKAASWDAQGQALPAPYGDRPMGQILIQHGRMLAALCNGNETIAPGARREYMSYGGSYTFDGKFLRTSVDLSSDPARIGGIEERAVTMRGPYMVLRPPLRQYLGILQQRELYWERIWTP